jgi:transposase
MAPKAVAREIGCTVNTVKNWLKVYDETQDVEGGTPKGRKSVTTKKQDRKIIIFAKAHQEAGPEEIAEKMKD